MFCLCVMFSPGLSWSESPEGMTFSKWADGFFATEGRRPFLFMRDPENSLDEFVTARPLNPGQGALWKPRIACSSDAEIPPPAMKTMKSAKLALRTVRAKGATGRM